VARLDRDQEVKRLVGVCRCATADFAQLPNRPARYW
jgi:hypothetical protein